eukprot:2445630-Pyramimonas_sp.AAC.1
MTSQVLLLLQDDARGYRPLPHHISCNQPVGRESLGHFSSKGIDKEEGGPRAHANGRGMLERKAVDGMQ